MKKYKFGGSEETKDPSQREIDKKSEDDDDDDLEDLLKDKDVVSREDNRIYFYGEVNREDTLKLIKNIRKASNLMITRSATLEQPAGNINLYINSFGGDLFSGLLASDIIRTNKVPIYTIIDGTAASAATVMSVVGTRRYMRKNSFALIHQLSSGAYGRYAEMKDEIQNCDMLMRVLSSIYEEFTKIPKKKLQNILSKDIWFTSKECIEFGIVDEII